jgi:hypothetical protein
MIYTDLRANPLIPFPFAPLVSIDFGLFSRIKSDLRAEPVDSFS